MTRRTPLLLAVVCLLLAGACGLSRSGEEAVEQEAGGSYGAGLDLDVEDEGGGTGEGSARGAQSSTGSGDGDPAVETVKPIQGLAKSSGLATPRDKSALGANALMYLRNTTPELAIEINAVNGREPSPGALSHLEAVLASVLDKPGGIDVLPVKTFTSSHSAYTESDVRRIEERERTEWSTQDRAVIHVLYLNGSSVENPRGLGAAYRASSIVVYPEELEDATTAIVGRTALERAVTVHEVGHLLGLVNIGYESPRDHEDPEHPGHSKNPDSVMYWAVETGAVATILGGPPPDDFDADDRADLADRRTGKL